MTQEFREIGTRVAVVGAGGGVGRFLTERWGATAFCRGDELDILDGKDLIVFCAASAQFETPLDELSAAIEDNFLLLERVTRRTPGALVYFSSCDVYPDTRGPHHEDESIRIEALSGGYASFKLMAEAIVRARCVNHIILRPTSLFGEGMRPNNIVRLLTQNAPDISLTAESIFNCVSYQAIAHLIEVTWAQQAYGTYNCASSTTVTLQEVADMKGYKGPMGKHFYAAPSLDNRRASALVEDFQVSSLDVIRSFVQAKL